MTRTDMHFVARTHRLGANGQRVAVVSHAPGQAEVNHGSGPV